MAKSRRLQPANLRGILPVLYHGGVRFIVIGGSAAIAHGLARMTLDVDAVYARDDDNLERIVSALYKHQPYPRDAPRGLPFQFDVATLKLGMNFTFETALGYLDLLGEVTGGGAYEEMLPHTQILDSYGLPIRYVTLDHLIHLKRSAGRPKDFETVAELEALRDERSREDNG